MQMIANRFIPTEEVQRLTVGSYEHVIARIEEAVRADSVKLLGAKLEAHVVGTFPGYAIVLVEDARFLRIKYEESQGVIRITGQESVQVESFAPDKLDTYLKNESQRAADAFVAGDVAGAIKRLKGLTKFVEHKNPQRDAQIVDAVIVFQRSDRLWKQVFAEKADVIRRSVLDEIASIQQDRFQSKFLSLYDGTIGESARETYRELVIESLVKIADRASLLAGQVEASVLDAQSKKIEDANVRALFAFSADLVSDLRGTHKAVRETLQRVLRLDCLGRLHDALAEDFKDRELASRFAVKMSKRLGETLPTDSVA